MLKIHGATIVLAEAAQEENAVSLLLIALPLELVAITLETARLPVSLQVFSLSSPSTDTAIKETQ